MVGIEADVEGIALKPLTLKPGLDHVQLARAIAIASVDSGDDPATIVGQRIGGDDIVKSEGFGDRGGVETIGSGGEDKPSAGLSVLFDPGPGTGENVGLKLPLGEASDDRFKPVGGRFAHQEPEIDLLQPAPVDQAGHE